MLINKRMSKGGVKKNKKKYGFIHIWVGGLVQDGDNIQQKKHAFKIHFRPF